MVTADMITRITVSNFRSIGEEVSLDLGPLTVLAGPNGSGKSSLADALVFVADCVRDGLGVALTRRGGYPMVHRAHPGAGPLGIRVHVETDKGKGQWSFSVGGGRAGDYEVLEEDAEWRAAGAVEKTQKLADARSRGAPVDLKTLAIASGAAPFSGAEALKSTVLYQLFPNRLRTPQPLDASKPMHPSGDNWASTLRSLPKDTAGNDLIAALGHITGDIVDYRTTVVGGFVIPEFCHRAANGSVTWLGAAQESDGTLRLAAMLTALLQAPPPTLMGFEEPELTVHSGAMGVLFDHLREASTRGQILLTTHSPELLDYLDVDEIRVIERQDGTTRVAPIARSQRALIKQRLATTSELLYSEGLRGATGTDDGE
jgi:predicted ATPase